jgi:hypothetical protein
MDSVKFMLNNVMYERENDAVMLKVFYNSLSVIHFSYFFFVF